MKLSQSLYKCTLLLVIFLTLGFYSVNSQAQNSKLNSSFDSSFTNYLLRGLSEAGKSPSSHILSVQVGSLKETLDLIEEYLKTSAAQSSYQQSYYSYFRDLYAWTVEVHEKNYEYYTASIYPGEVRQNSLNLIAGYKTKVMKRTHQLFTEIKWGSRTTVLLPNDLNRLSTELSLILSYLNDNPILLNHQEAKDYQNTVIKDWVQLTVRFFRGLELRSSDLSSTQLENSFFSNLAISDRLSDYILLMEELLKPSNRHLVTPRPGANAEAVYRTLSFAILYIDRMPKVAKTPALREKVLETIISPADLNHYRTLMGELVPESMVEFIIAENLTVKDFLTQLNQVSADYEELVDNFTPHPLLEKINLDFKTYFVGQVGFLSAEYNKKIRDPITLMNMFFQGTLPYVDQDQIDKALPFSSASVDSRSFVALDPIFDHYVYLLTNSPFMNLTVREFNERLVLDFMILGSKMEDLTSSTYGNLEKLFEFYSQSQLSSRWIKQLAFGLVENIDESPDVNFWTMQMAATDYLLVSDPENGYYRMLRTKIQDQRPEFDLYVTKNKYDGLEYGLKDTNADKDSLASGLQSYSPYLFSNVQFKIPKPVQVGRLSESCTGYLSE